MYLKFNFREIGSWIRKPERTEQSEVRDSGREVGEEVLNERSEFRNLTPNPSGSATPIFTEKP